MKDVKKEEEKKIPPKEKNKKNTLPQNKEHYGTPPPYQDVDMKEETLTDPHMVKKNTPAPEKKQQLS